ncbi:MAG: DUF1553 domain-containing protein [Cyclobacteriaceae bacterium]
MSAFYPKIFLFLAVLGLSQACKEEKIDFSTQVKPILNKRCISCHGGVKQNAGFSVLFRQEALDTTESGKYAIVPGDPDHSEMIRRINLSDPEQRMPYKEEPLTKAEIQTLTKWIEQGAEWGDHWAYVPPKAVEIPKSNRLLSGISSPSEKWTKNDIDYFILQQLDKRSLKPSAEADRPTLVRRVYLDVIGVPPTPEQAEKFFMDESPDAYEKVVDELLVSPHYGEKWASWWLDLARYADTKGYEADPGRVIWRYRDYVIKSFNADKPFDQFALEQIAGDMLPDPTDDQIIATAFHRNTMNNDEGGTDDEEFRLAAVIDRVSTTWEVFQSTTMSCVQCHSHPYDPIRHEEYYKGMAYFNNTRDEDVSGEHPLLRTYEEQDQEKLDAIKLWVSTHSDETQASQVTRFLKTLEPKIHSHVFDQFENGELNGYKWLSIRPGGSARLKHISLDKKARLLINYSRSAPGGSFEIRKDHRNGEVIGSIALPKTDKPRVVEISLKPSTGTHELYFVFKNPNLKRDQSVCTIEWFSFQEELPGRNTAEFASMKSTFLELLNAPVENTPVFIESTPAQKRKSYVFERGNWLVKGEQVSPDVPKAFNTTSQNVPPDRLGFAQWLVSKDNPMAARTIVNRVWEQIFGYGLVETLEDFGSQGASPTHPELLDWLAIRMMTDHQWSVKKLIRDIVLSATYRQQSQVTDEVLELDQRNEWLARGARVRLSAEQVRDQALAVSGLLSKKMYGKSVMPYQPEGIWNSVYNSEKWIQSEGEDQYRRGVYTFIKRTSPYPSLMMFDGSSREVCISRRIRTNTPLQALVTLNDPVFVEAARELAKRMMASDSASSEKGIRTGYRLLTFKDIPNEKLQILDRLYDEAIGVYKQDTAAVHAITKEKNGTPQRAAMTVVANAMLNLDEVITKE